MHFSVHSTVTDVKIKSYEKIKNNTTGTTTITTNTITTSTTTERRKNLFKC